LIEVDLRLLRRGVAHHPLVVLLHRLDRHGDLRQIGLGIVERDLELPRVQPVQNLAGFDLLIVLHRHVLDDARHIGGNPDLLGLDIGVVGRHHLTAGDVVIAGGEQHCRQERKQTPPDAVAPGQSTSFVASRSPLAAAFFRRRQRRNRMRPRALGHLVANRRDWLARELSHSGALLAECVVDGSAGADFL
jgi:hypothetical protein